MKGDIINLNDEYRNTAKKLAGPLIKEIKNYKNIYTFSVAGESGAGKSITAAAIAEFLEHEGFNVKIFQQDDYFYLPPFANDQKRRKDLKWVGPQEINLSLLDQHLKEAKLGVAEIIKPLVIYSENKITREIFDMKKVQVCIAEGTYTSLLKNINKRIFIDRNYKDTFNDRKNRARDKMDPFNEDVLKIEHQIIQQHKQMADIILDNNFNAHNINNT